MLINEVHISHLVCVASLTGGPYDFVVPSLTSPLDVHAFY